MKRLGKSHTNKVISGVCGGVVEYFNVDPTIVRLIWAGAILFAGTGLWVYILCAVLMPYAYNEPFHHMPPHDYHGHSHSDDSNHSN